MFKSLFLTVLGFGFINAHAKNHFNATVVSVSDGDTVTVLMEHDPNEKVCVRLLGIDAPESKQAYGQASRDFLNSYVYRQPVNLVCQKRKDRYERLLCHIWYQGVDVNLALVEEGLAWVYRQFNNDPKYYQAEKRAKQERKGLWQDAEPTPPWTYRKQNR